MSAAATASSGAAPLSAALAAAGAAITTSPATARTAATCRCRCSASGRSPGVGDDTITNFNVPTFYYGGEPYTRIGVVSNGYIVIGGGDSERHRLHPADVPERCAAEQRRSPRSGPISTRPAAGRRDPRGHAHRWRRRRLDRRRLRAASRTSATRRRTRSRSGSGPRGAPAPGPRASRSRTRTARTTFPGDGPDRQCRLRRSDSVSTGARRTATARAARTSPSAPANSTEYRPLTRRRPTPGGSVSIPFDVSSKKAGTWHSDATHDVRHDAGHDRRARRRSPSLRKHQYASNDARGRPSGRPLVVPGRYAQC